MQFNFLFSTVTDTLIKNLNFTGAGSREFLVLTILICYFDGSAKSTGTGT
jgi:hypothetical protein